MKLMVADNCTDYITAYLFYVLIRHCQQIWRLRVWNKSLEISQSDLFQSQTCNGCGERGMRYRTNTFFSNWQTTRHNF